MKYAPYSYSKISTHKQCNRKFKYRYVDKVKPQKCDMTALLKGGAVHHILEHYPEQSSHKLASRHQHVVDKFVESRLGELYLRRTSTREHDFGLSKTLKPCSYHDKTALFRGSIDYVTVIDDILHLVDWKTGKFKDERWQDYDQLMFYAVYFFIKFSNINTVKISYVYVEHDNAEHSMILKREHFDSYKKQLLTSIKKTENDEEFKKIPSKLCDWCEFQNHCDDSVYK